MRVNALLGSAAVAVGLAIAAHSLDAYTLLSHRWSAERIPVALQLDDTSDQGDEAVA